jgi:hypothetical protein
MSVSHRSITRRTFLKSAACAGALLAIPPNWRVLPLNEEPAWQLSNNLDKPYNQAHWLAAHNAFTNPHNGYSLDDNFYTNQRSSITDQLQYGVRGLLLDIYWQNNPNDRFYNQIVCAHTATVIRQERDILFQDVLNEITTWMQRQENRDEVVTLFFEDYINGHHDTLAQQLRATGLWFNNARCEKAATGGWPTLREMCQQDPQNHESHRLVAFVEKTPLDKQNTSDKIPHTYDYVVETKYGHTGVDEATNIDTWATKRSASAPLDGPAKLRRISAENTLALVNHFKNTPFWTTSNYANRLNHLGFLKQHIDYYIWNNRRVPNFLALDFADVGGGREAIAYLGTKQAMYGYSWTPFVGEMHPGTIDWDTEYFISMPAPYYLVGIEVIDEGGYGITNMMTYGTADYHKQNLGIFPAFGRALKDPNVGWVNNEFKGKQRSFVCPQGTYIDAVQVAKHHKWGIVNLRCHMRDRGWANWITDNEKENAEAVTVPHIVSRICGFHIKYEGGHGLVDMRYSWAGGLDTLAPGDTLEVGRTLRSSDLWYSLEMQSDGNLVLYRSPDRQALWATHTNKKLATQVVMQGDGNLVLYTADRKPLWASNTNAPKNQGAVLRLQNDGNLVIYKGTKAIWASHTVDR